MNCIRDRKTPRNANHFFEGMVKMLKVSPISKQIAGLFLHFYQSLSI